MSRLPRAAAAALCLGALGACRTYEPAPLDPAGALASFLERTPADAAVAAFAERLFAAGAGPVAFDPRNGLDADEAEVVALFFNPELRRLRADAGVLAASAGAAGAYADPVFGLDAERVLKDVDDPWLVGGTVGLTVPLSGRRGAERDAATAAARAARAEVAAAEWETRAEVRRACHRRAAAALRAEALAAHVAAVAEADAVVARLAEAGETPRIEARLFAFERATRAAELRAAQADVVEADAELRALLGLAPSAPATFPAALAPPAAPLADAATTAAEAARDHPRVAARRAAHDAAEEALRAAVAAQFPDLVLSPGLGVEDGLARALFGVAAAPPLFDGNRRAIAEAEALRAAARAAFDAETETVYGLAAAAHARASAAAEVSAGLARDVAPLADAQLADVRRAAEAGRFQPLVVLETLVRVHDARRRLIDARADEALARERVRELVGPPPYAASSRPAAEETP